MKIIADVSVRLLLGVGAVTVDARDMDTYIAYRCCVPVWDGKGIRTAGTVITDAIKGDVLQVDARKLLDWLNNQAEKIQVIVRELDVTIKCKAVNVPPGVLAIVTTEDILSVDLNTYVQQLLQDGYEIQGITYRESGYTVVAAQLGGM